jgi:F-type H+-transporting ATPase subunit b
MPQIAQIASTYAGQIFWLLIVFGFIYFGIGRSMLPKIEATVDARNSKIADEAKTAAALATEKRVKAADIVSAGKVADAEAAIRLASAEALANIESAAAEAAQNIVTKLSGMSVTPRAAAAAVRKAMSDG